MKETEDLVTNRSTVLIPTFDIEHQLVEILQNVKGINENSVIEYKVVPHSGDFDTELFKDILGLANSYERPGEDRWLIYGVNNKTHDLVGVDQNNPDLLDDSAYQQKFKKIQPDLHIEFHRIPARSVNEDFSSDKVFAAFYIPCECMNEVYELGQCVSDKEEKNGKVKTFPPGTSFVRFGSSTEPLFEYDRAKKRELAMGRAAQPFLVAESCEDAGLTKSADILLLLGSWDEASEADREHLTTASGEPYSKAIKELQPMLDDGFFCMRGSRWVAVDKVEGIRRAGKHLTKPALLALAEPFGAILSSIDMVYDLAPDERIMADVKKTQRGCSRSLRKSVAEFCAQIGNNPDLLPQCEQNDIDRFVAEVINVVFRTDDWRVLASAEDCMPLLAEASPAIYLSAVDSCSNTDSFQRFLQEKTGGFTSMSLGLGLIRGIRIAAMSHGMLSQAIKVLVNISDSTDLTKNAIIDLLLPWYPSTDASVQSKIGIGKYLSKQPNKTSWQALMALLPGNTTSTFGVVEPIYMPLSEKPESILMSEYWEVSRAYCCQALAAIQRDIAKLLDVISSISCYEKAGLIDEFCKTVFAEAQSLSDDDCYKVWNQLSSYVQQCEKFSKAEWVPSDEVIQKIKNLTDQLRPCNPFYLALRLCSIHDWDFIGDDENLTEGQERVAQLRAQSIRDLYEKRGVDVVKDLVDKGAKGNSVGVAISFLDISAEDEQAVYAFIDDDNVEMLSLVRAYVGNSFVQNGWAWIDSVNMKVWSKEQIAIFYSFLPLSKDAWSRAEKLLGEDSALYWSRAPVYGPVKDPADLSYCVECLLNNGQVANALGLLEREVREDVSVSADLIKKALWNLHVKNVDSMLSYHIKQLLEYLEVISCDDELFALELRYSGLIHDKQKSYLYRRMTEDPEAFLLVVSIAYNLDLITEKDIQASNDVRFSFIYQVLHNWKLVPGYDLDDFFDERFFCKWIEDVRSRIDDSHALECVDCEIGHTLFYAKSENGFMFPKEIAEYLENNEAALEGYKLEAFNSRGVYTVDPTGAPEDEIADGYEQKAALAEALGYLNIAVAMRSVARLYRDEAERNRNRGIWD